jgi:hypothetical protein
MSEIFQQSAVLSAASFEKEYGEARVGVGSL